MITKEDLKSAFIAGQDNIWCECEQCIPILETELCFNAWYSNRFKAHNILEYDNIDELGENNSGCYGIDAIETLNKICKL